MNTLPFFSLLQHCIYFLAGERRTIALLPKGAFNIQFWFSYAAMKKNFLGVLSEKSGDILVSYHTEVHGMGSIVHLCMIVPHTRVTLSITRYLFL